MPLSRDSSGGLLLGGAVLAELVRETDTPAYVYDVDAIAEAARSLRASFGGAPHLAAYAVKANSAGRIVRTLAKEGCGADVVSAGELLLALRCGIGPDRIIYSGVAKLDSELDRAIGSGPRGIAAVQVESAEEIVRVEARARNAGRVARVSLRVNPGVDLTGATHAHIATGHPYAKFGVSRDNVSAAVQRVLGSQWLELVGMATHAGSQFMTTTPYVDSARVLFRIVRDLRAGGHGRSLTFVNSGGGFGVDYGAAPPSSSKQGGEAQSNHRCRAGHFIEATRALQREFGLDDLALYIEPGRWLVAPFGVLVARVVQPKVTSTGRWLMIDAGMNDLLRPALYQARHRIVPLETPADASDTLLWHVVGPVCESSDDFGEHELPRTPPASVAILDAGAYGFAMASQYNGRQLPNEVFVSGGRWVTGTRRITADSWAEQRADAGGE